MRIHLLGPSDKPACLSAGAAKPKVGWTLTEDVDQVDCVKCQRHMELYGLAAIDEHGKRVRRMVG